MSTRLPLPVRRVLREPYSPERIERIVAERRAPSRTRLRTPLAVLAVAAAVLLAWIAWPTRDDAPGPLHRADGASLPGALSGTVALDDGSTIEVQEHGRLATLENDAHDVSLLLDEGTATFDVTPHGPRRWTIECGLATVSVVGTRFTIAREAHRLVVAVERGVVLVRGERVPDHARRLGAGERIEVTEPAPEVTTPVAAPSVPTAPEVTDVPASSRAEPVARTPAWRALAEQTEWNDAFRALGPGGVPAASADASVDDLLLLADVARLSGHLDDAIDPLARVMDEHATDPRASFAAFSLGRLEDQLGDSARAAYAFERAVQLEQMPPTLRADAIARRARALDRAGDRAGAVEAARAYLSEVPDGPAADAMRAMVEAR